MQKVLNLAKEGERGRDRAPPITLSTSPRALQHHLIGDHCHQRWSYRPIRCSWPFTTQRKIIRRKHKMRDGRPTQPCQSSRASSLLRLLQSQGSIFRERFTFLQPRRVNDTRVVSNSPFAVGNKYSLGSRRYIPSQLRQSACSQNLQKRAPISMHIGWANVAFVFPKTVALWRHRGDTAARARRWLFSRSIAVQQHADADRDA